MTTNRPLTLRVDPHADAELIAGWVCDERGDEQRFEGWLDLFTLLERTLWGVDCPQCGTGHAGTGRRVTRNE